MARLWRCALRTRALTGLEGTTYGYGATPAKALADATDVSVYRKETRVPNHKPHLDQVDEGEVTEQPMSRRS